MKITKGKIGLLIFSTLIGFILVNSININGSSSGWSNMSAVDYKEAIDKRNSLYNEIELLEKHNSQIQETIDKYNEDSDSSEKIVETMKNQLKDYNMLVGGSTVKGPGVILKINDGDIDSTKDTYYERWRKTFHDNDMAMVINEVRAAGAEAFALNNKRILPFNGVSCNWAFLGFEDDSLEYAPFYIFIIGDPEQLEVALLNEDSYVSKLKIRGLEVSLTKEEEIILKSSEQDTSVKYAQLYEGTSSDKKENE